MVEHPADYPWSSYRANAYGERDAALAVHGCLHALGRTTEERSTAYRELFRTDLEPATVHEIRRAANFSVPLGNERFRAQVEQALGRSTGHAARGRPVKVRRK